MSTRSTAMSRRTEPFAARSRFATRRCPSGHVPASGRARSSGHLERLQGALDRVAEELVGLGYFGPVGIDAFTWRDADGAVQLRSVSR